MFDFLHLANCVYSDATFYINAASGNDNNGDGSLSKPWATLIPLTSKAILPSPPASITIMIGPGKYLVSAFNLHAGYNWTFQKCSSCFPKSIGSAAVLSPVKDWNSANTWSDVSSDPKGPSQSLQDWPTSIFFDANPYSLPSSVPPQHTLTFTEIEFSNPTISWNSDQLSQVPTESILFNPVGMSLVFDHCHLHNLTFVQHSPENISSIVGSIYGELLFESTTVELNSWLYSGNVPSHSYSGFLGSSNSSLIALRNTTIAKNSIEGMIIQGALFTVGHRNRHSTNTSFPQATFESMNSTISENIVWVHRSGSGLLLHSVFRTSIHMENTLFLRNRIAFSLLPADRMTMESDQITQDELDYITTVHEESARNPGAWAGSSNSFGDTYGGAFSIDYDHVGYVVLQNVTMNGNRASYGGGIAIVPNLINPPRFTFEPAESANSLDSVVSNTIFFNNVDFIRNRALLIGSSIFVRGNHLQKIVFQGCTFDSNLGIDSIVGIGNLKLLGRFIIPSSVAIFDMMHGPIVVMNVSFAHTFYNLPDPYNHVHRLYISRCSSFELSDSNYIHAMPSIGDGAYVHLHSVRTISVKRLSISPPIPLNNIRIPTLDSLQYQSSSLFDILSDAPIEEPEISIRYAFIQSLFIIDSDPSLAASSSISCYFGEISVEGWNTSNYHPNISQITPANDHDPFGNGGSLVVYLSLLIVKDVQSIVVDRLSLNNISSPGWVPIVNIYRTTSVVLSNSDAKDLNTFFQFSMLEEFVMTDFITTYYTGYSAQFRLASITNVTIDNYLAGWIDVGSAIRATMVYNMTIRNSFFYNCSSTDGPVVLDSNAYVSIVSSDFLFNEGALGGAISSIAVDYAELDLDDCSFYDNFALSDGGAISVQGHALDVFNCTFSKNLANDDGGAISMVSGELTVSESTFYKNRAWSADGGAISCSNPLGKPTTHIITRSTFDSNGCISSGGALRIVGQSNIPFPIPQATISQCDFVDNAALASAFSSPYDPYSSGIGGAIFTSVTTWLVSNGFGNNSAGTGGAVFLENGTLDTIRPNLNPSFSNMMQSEDLSSWWKNDSMDPFEARKYFKSILASVESPNLILNSDPSSPSTISLVVSHSAFVQNIVATFGGAVAMVASNNEHPNMAADSNAIFFGNAFLSNIALGSGGALYTSALMPSLEAPSQDHEASNLFFANYGVYGGVIYLSIASHLGNFHNQIFEWNFAESGGGIAYYGSIYIPSDPDDYSDLPPELRPASYNGIISPNVKFCSQNACNNNTAGDWGSEMATARVVISIASLESDTALTESEPDTVLTLIFQPHVQQLLKVQATDQLGQTSAVSAASLLLPLQIAYVTCNSTERPECAWVEFQQESTAATALSGGVSLVDATLKFNKPVMAFPPYDLDGYLTVALSSDIPEFWIQDVFLSARVKFTNCVAGFGLAQSMHVADALLSPDSFGLNVESNSSDDQPFTYKCVACPLTWYSLNGTCESCRQIPEVSCSSNLVVVRRNWWVDTDVATNRMQVLSCPIGYCLGGVDNPCSFGRSGPLCGTCSKPLSLSMIGTCMICDKPNIVMIGIWFIGSWLLVLAMHQLLAVSSGKAAIFTYFIQVALLLSADVPINSAYHFDRWIGSGWAAWFFCLYPMDALQRQVVFGTIPLIMMLQLILTVGAVSLVTTCSRRCRSRNRNSLFENDEDNNPHQPLMPSYLLDIAYRPKSIRKNVPADSFDHLLGPESPTAVVPEPGVFMSWENTSERLTTGNGSNQDDDDNDSDADEDGLTGVSSSLRSAPLASPQSSFLPPSELDLSSQKLSELEYDQLESSSERESESEDEGRSALIAPFRNKYLDANASSSSTNHPAVETDYTNFSRRTLDPTSSGDVITKDTLPPTAAQHGQKWPMGYYSRQTYQEHYKWKFENQFFHSYRLVRTLLALLIISFSTSLDTILSMQGCIKLLNGTSVLQSAPSISCQSNSFKLWRLTWIFFIPYLLVSVIVIFFKLLHSFSNRQLSQSDVRFGVMYEMYRPRMFLWKLSELARRFILCLVAGLTVAAPVLKYTLFCIFCSLFFMVHILARPYRQRLENTLESISLFSLTMITIACIWQFNSNSDAIASPALIIWVLIPAIGILILMAFPFRRLDKPFSRLLHTRPVQWIKMRLKQLYQKCSDQESVSNLVTPHEEY